MSDEQKTLRNKPLTAERVHLTCPLKLDHRYLQMLPLAKRSSNGGKHNAPVSNLTGGNKNGGRPLSRWTFRLKREYKDNRFYASQHKRKDVL